MYVICWMVYRIANCRGKCERCWTNENLPSVVFRHSCGSKRLIDFTFASENWKNTADFQPHAWVFLEKNSFNKLMSSSCVSGRTNFHWHDGPFFIWKTKTFQDPWNVLVEVRPEETPSRCVVAVAVILRGKEFSEGRANYVYFLKEVKSLPLSPRLFVLVVVFSSRLGQFVPRNYYKIA